MIFKLFKRKPKTILIITGRRICLLQFCEKYNYNPHNNKVIHIRKLQDLLGINLYNKCGVFFTWGFEDINYKEIIKIENYLKCHNIKFQYKDY